MHIFRISNQNPCISLPAQIATSRTSQNGKMLPSAGIKLFFSEILIKTQWIVTFHAALACRMNTELEKKHWRTRYSIFRRTKISCKQVIYIYDHINIYRPIYMFLCKCIFFLFLYLSNTHMKIASYTVTERYINTSTYIPFRPDID